MARHVLAELHGGPLDGDVVQAAVRDDGSLLPRTRSPCRFPCSTNAPRRSGGTPPATFPPARPSTSAPSCAGTSPTPAPPRLRGRQGHPPRRTPPLHHSAREQAELVSAAQLTSRPDSRFAACY